MLLNALVFLKNSFGRSKLFAKVIVEIPLLLKPAFPKLSTLLKSMLFKFLVFSKALSPKPATPFKSKFSRRKASSKNLLGKL